MQTLSLLQIIGLIAYWLSFSMIGAVVFIRFTEFASSHNKQLSRQLNQLGSLSILFICNCFGILTVGLSFIPAYLFHLPLLCLELYYFLLLLISIRAFRFHFKTVITGISTRIQSKDKLRNIIALVALITLIINAIVAWHVGQSIQYDSPLHMARINSVSNGNLSLIDPFFGYNHVYDLRYSVNVTATILGIASHMLGINAVTIWTHSYAWFTTMLCICIASICEFFIRIENKRFRSYFGLIVLGLAPFLANVHHLFTEANMPSKVVTMWQALFFIGLYTLLKTKNPFILIAASLLIAMTQPMMAVAAIAFICLLNIFLLLYRDIKFKDIKWLFISVVILAIPVLLELMQKSFLKSDPLAWHAVDGSYGVLNLEHIGHYIFQKPHLTFPITDMLVYAIAGLSLIFISRLRYTWQQTIYLLILFGLSLAFYNQNLTILAGILYLIYYAKDRSLRLIILLGSVLYSLIIYNPLLMTALSHNLPPWFLERLQSWNIFGIVGIFTTLYYTFAHQPLKWRFKVKDWSIYIAGSLYIVLVYSLLGQLHWSFNSLPYDNIPDKLHETRSIFEPFAKSLNGQIVIVADNWSFYSSYVPVVSNAYILGGMRPEQADPASNILLRDKCEADIIQNLSPNDIAASKVTRIIVNGNEYPALLQRLKQSANFKYDGAYKDWQLFELTKLPTVHLSSSSVCNIPRGQ